ncbi:MAG: CorA family divalent cation transporter [Propionicimonas sp.]|uniref:CorA family divalent cation transporter n=1 Tax=Propionicimonas sp. TaxID=1955623 RepID=UPI003D0FCEDE
MAVQRVLWVDRASGAVTKRTEAELPALLADPSGWLWLDVPEPDEQTAALLAEVFKAHPAAVADVVERNHVPRLHAYGDTLFLVLLRPEAGLGGHMHYLELDQFIAANYLVTTHGPRNLEVPLERLLEETDELADRMLSGRYVPSGPWAASHRIASALAITEERSVNRLAREVGGLEQQVLGHAGDNNPQAFLEELFHTRHALLTVRTMTMQTAEIYGRAIGLMGDTDPGVRKVLRDNKDAYDRLSRITSSQLDYLSGVTEYYRARTDTKMTIAAERLAVIAAITLPVTAISSVLGMNVIVNQSTDWLWLGILLAVMIALSLVLLRWAKRQGWW